MSILLVAAFEDPPGSSNAFPSVFACDISAGMPSIFSSPAERDRGRLAVPSETVPRLSLMAETMSIICGVDEIVLTRLELTGGGGGTITVAAGGVGSRGYSVSCNVSRASVLSV